MKIQIKRTYDSPSAGDGIRILVERLWPRGIKKDDLDMDLWLKEVAPSTDLRKWFSHDPAKWKQFQEKYYHELDTHPEALEQLISELHKGPVTFLYSSRDTEHNSALCLKHYLESHMTKKIKK